MIYRCLIVDDSPFDRFLITKYLNKIDGIEVAAICTDGFEASKKLDSEHIDILFSDIDMPNLSGIELVKNLNQSPVTIFITSHLEYAVEGFNLNVIDYVVKPMSFKRFSKAVEKAKEYLSLKNAVTKDSGIVNSKEASDNNILTSSEYFFLKEANLITRIKYSDVLYVESLGDYSKVFIQNGEKYITLVSLKSMERQLPKQQFKRVHKQYIVNLSHIVTIAANEVILSDKQVVPVNIAARLELIELLTDNKILTR